MPSEVLMAKAVHAGRHAVRQSLGWALSIQRMAPTARSRSRPPSKSCRARRNGCGWFVRWHAPIPGQIDRQFMLIDFPDRRDGEARLARLSGFCAWSRKRSRQCRRYL